MGGPYQPPGASNQVATVDIAFKSLDRATITFTGTASADAMEVKTSPQRTEEITRQFDDLFQPFFDFYVGGAAMQMDVDIPVDFFGGSNHTTLTVSDMTWQLNSVDAFPLEQGGLQTATYILLTGRFELTSHVQSIVTDPDIGTVTCNFDATGTVVLQYPFTSAAVLKVSNLGGYTVKLSFDPTLVPQAGTIRCVGAGGGVVEDVQPPLLPAPPLEASGTGTAVGANGPEISVPWPLKN